MSCMQTETSTRPDCSKGYSLGQQSWSMKRRCKAYPAQALTELARHTSLQMLPGIHGLHAYLSASHIESRDNMYNCPLGKGLHVMLSNSESNSCFLEVEVNKLNKVFGLHTQGVHLCSRQNTLSALRQMELSGWIRQMCLSLDLSLTIVDSAHSG